MKKQSSKKTIWQSAISISVLFLFIYLGFGSTSLFGLLGVPLNTKTEYNEQTDRYTKYIYGISGEKGDTSWVQEVDTERDSYGRWHDYTTIKNSNYYYDKDSEKLYTRTSTERTFFGDGKRHYVSITENTSYYQTFIDNNRHNEVSTFDTTCYDYGHVIPCDQRKSTSIISGNSLGFQILKDNYPWFLGSLNVLGFTNEYVQAYMDTIEVLLEADNFAFSSFDSHYDDVIELLAETTYDSLVQINKMVTSVFGIELMKDLEFRMAVIDQQREKDKGTFYFLQNGYPHFLTSFNSETTIVQDSEWEAFCSKFDSLMNTFLPLDNNDPFFVDSVDSRIFSTLMSIAQEEPDTTKSAIIKSVFKQVGTNMQNLSLSSLLKEHETILLQQQTESIKPQAFATAILIRMARKYLFEGDVPRLAVKEAFANQQSVLQLAIVTTHLNGKISEYNFELLGNVIKDGGAEITERGMVWAKYNNPTVDDNKILAGEGIGGFTATLQINDNDNYYIKAFATNSVGTAYGNSVIINNNYLVGLDNVESGNFDAKIYPNPASSEVYLDFEIRQPENISIEIIDLNGRIVFQKPIQKTQIGKNHININISGLKNGMYICNVKGERIQPFAQKIYKTH